MPMFIDGKEVKKVVVNGTESPSVYYRKGEAAYSLVFERDPAWVEYNVFDPFNDGSSKAFLPFDGDYLDKVGSYDGVGTGTLFKPGKFDSAVEINSFGANVAIAKQDLIDFTKTFAISLWIKPLVEDSSYQGVFSKPVPSGNNYSPFTLYKVGKKLTYYLTSGYGSWSISGGTIGTNDLKHSDWNHIVFQRTSTGYECYINNVLDFKIGSTANLWMNVYDYKIGSAYPGIQDFKGLVDQFRVFNRMLSTEERDILFTEKV